MKEASSSASFTVTDKSLFIRARKRMVSWYPGYQPMSNLAANFGTTGHQLRINSQLLAGPMTQSATKV